MGTVKGFASDHSASANRVCAGGRWVRASAVASFIWILLRCRVRAACSLVRATPRTFLISIAMRAVDSRIRVLLLASCMRRAPATRILQFRRNPLVLLWMASERSGSSPPRPRGPACGIRADRD
jgi:hypothetical protein